MKITKTASGKTQVSLNQQEWASIGKKAGWMKESQYGLDSVSLGPTPPGEDCAQVGTDDYYKWTKIEIRAYAKQIQRLFPDMPPNVRLKISSNPHDFGTYHELEVVFNSNDEDAMNYAFDMENNTPEYWDELAKEELRSQGYPYLRE